MQERNASLHGKFQRNILTLNQTYVFGVMQIIFSLLTASIIDNGLNGDFSNDTMRKCLLLSMGSHLIVFHILIPVFLIFYLRANMPDLFENGPNRSQVVPTSPSKQFHVIRPGGLHPRRDEVKDEKAKDIRRFVFLKTSQM